MKIIDAIWEKRNLGLTVIEVSIEDTDDDNSIRKALTKLEADYIVLRQPCGINFNMFLLAELGFVFAECMNQLKSPQVMPPLNHKKQKILDDSRLEKMDEKDFDVFLKRLESGVFTRDRLSMDSNFTPKDVANHYIGFANDDKARDTEYYDVIYQNEKVGFTSLKKIDETYYDITLTGLYPEFIGKGLSVINPYKTLEVVKLKGGEYTYSNVSSTNVASIKHYCNNGYVINKSEYVYVKHIKK